jgi:hypothetical protein
MKSLPTGVAIGVGIVVLADFFISHWLLDAIGAAFREWAIILSAFALLLGLANLLNVHVVRIIRREESGGADSLIVLLTTGIVTLIGLFTGLSGAPMTWIFENVYVPLQSTFFALLAFFMAAAAYRGLRARNRETLLMLLAAIIVFLAQTPILSFFADAKDWVLRFPAEAGVRGMLIGIGLGTLATGLRLLVGLDRPYSE